MLNSIPLKCSNCGANLQITPEMETFACGYCGASQVVERSGGTVSLRLLTEAIKKVQAGTDKTAAELAIRRLKEEYASLENTYDELNTARWSKEFALRKPYTWLGLVLIFVTPVIVLAGGWAAILSAFIWIGFTALTIYTYLKQSKANKEFYELPREKIFLQMQDILKRINENKKIVGF